MTDERTGRRRALVGAVLLGAAALLIAPGAAWSEEETPGQAPSSGAATKTVAQDDHETSGAPEAEGEGGPAQGHISECVIDAVEAGTEAEECVKAPNPIVPALNELVWGAISFVVLFFLLAKKGYPAIKKGMDARATRIQSSIDDADRAKAEAGTILEQYQRQLADARNESARIIDEARQTADQLRQDLKRQAEAEVAEVRQRAQADIDAQVARAMADLQARVATLSIELAERVVERSLDRDTNMALIERFIDQAGSRN